MAGPSTRSVLVCTEKARDLPRDGPLYLVILPEIEARPFGSNPLCKPLCGGLGPSYTSPYRVGSILDLIGLVSAPLAERPPRASFRLASTGAYLSLVRPLFVISKVL